MLDEQSFRDRCDSAMTDLERSLSPAMERYDFEADFSGGALKIEFEDPPAKFVVSPNSPVRQIWISAHLQSFKLDWNEPASAFVHTESGRTLKALVADAISRQLGEEVML